MFFFQNLPFDAPFETPFETPFEAPFETPFELPFAALFICSPDFLRLMKLRKSIFVIIPSGLGFAGAEKKMNSVEPLKTKFLNLIFIVANMSIYGIKHIIKYKRKLIRKTNGIDFCIFRMRTWVFVKQTF